MTNINTPIHISSPDSESSEDEPNQPFRNIVTTNSSIRSSSAPRQSGRTKRPTREVEPQKGREAEPKKRKSASQR